MFQEKLAAAGYGEITTEIAPGRRLLLRRALPPAVPGQEPQRLLRPRAAPASAARSASPPPETDSETAPTGVPTRGPTRPRDRLRSAPAVAADLVAVGVDGLARPSAAGRGSRSGGRPGPASACRRPRRSCRWPRRADRRRWRPCPSPARSPPRRRRTRPAPRPTAAPRSTPATSASSSSRCSTRPAKVAKRGSSPTPIRRITRPATESDEVDTATHSPVRAAVRAARDRVGDAGAEARLLLAGQPVHRDERAHQLEQRLQQVDVDHLADAGVERHHAWRTRRPGR